MSSSSPSLSLWDSFGKTSSSARRSPHCGQLQSDQTASWSFFGFGFLVPARKDITTSCDCSVMVMLLTMHAVGACQRLVRAAVELGEAGFRLSLGFDGRADCAFATDGSLVCEGPSIHLWRETACFSQVGGSEPARSSLGQRFAHSGG